MADDLPSRETRLEVARSILTRNLKVRKGEHVIVEGWTHTLPWAVAIAREARRLGAQPLIVYEDEAEYWDAVDQDGPDSVGALAAHENAAWLKTDVYIHMWGPGDRIRLGELPDSKTDRMFAWNSVWYATARKAGLRGARLELGRPYPSVAKAYGTTPEAWTRQLVAASLVDPAALVRSAAPITRGLSKGSELHIEAPNGTDLTLRLAGKEAFAQTGLIAPARERGPFGMLTSVPNGAVRVALDPTTASGTFVANRGSFYDDSVATGATFHFADGRLTEATFDRGGERFDREFSKGGKGRDRPGWFGVGLNPELRAPPMIEDVERGAITVTLGGNRQFGGANSSPFFGWAVNTGATVEVDGRAISP